MKPVTNRRETKEQTVDETDEAFDVGSDPKRRTRSPQKFEKSTEKEAQVSKLLR